MEEEYKTHEWISDLEQTTDQYIHNNIYIETSNTKCEDDAIKTIRDLFAKYIDNSYMQTRMQNYICCQLPNIFDNIQKDHEYRAQRMEELTNEQQHFVKAFVSNNQYFYVPNVEKFFHYDGVHYKMYSEDDILHHIFMSIRQDKTLMCWKQRTKHHIMKKIKENNLLRSVPESETIQNVLDALHPTFFETKSEAKYFLCVLGDGILKKNTHLIHFMNPQSKNFIRELNNICQMLIGVQLNGTIKHKYYEHDYPNCRVIHIHETCRIESVWVPMLTIHALDLICVACHYSIRYNSSDEYLITSCNDVEIVNSVFYLKNVKQTELILMFINDYLEVHRYRRLSGDITDPTSCIMTSISMTTQIVSQITWKDMQYLWKQFLESKRLPNIIFQQTLKGLLVQQLNDYYRESQDSFVGISCKHLPSIQRFILFWDRTMVIDESGASDNFEYEINEILFLYKKWCENMGEYVGKMLNEKEILDIITYFHPEIEIDKNKYIYRTKCILWDKQMDVQMGLDYFKEATKVKYDALLESTMMRRSHSQSSIVSETGTANSPQPQHYILPDMDITLYDAYVFYCAFAKKIHKNTEQIVSKSYFEKCVAEYLEEYLLNDGKNISVTWLDKTKYL
jgi:hypothetical protein